MVQRRGKSANFMLVLFLVTFSIAATLLPQIFLGTFNGSNGPTSVTISTGTATSGRRCKLAKSRTFDRQTLFYKDRTAATPAPAAMRGKNTPLIKSSFNVNKPCRYWGTLTTIFNATEAVRTLPPDWCLVVAADRKGPTEYDVSPNTLLLSVEKQEELAQHFDLVDNLPWNHFARKNVAYLFAILNKAEWIWDFDDDNILYRTPNVNDYVNGVLFEPRDKSNCGAMNPYQWLDYPPNSGTNASFWPRGYPLELIHEPACEAVSKCVVNQPSIGIYQAIADGDPDVDAIYRLTGKLPVFFEQDTKELPILVPDGMVSPMNAQAALVHVARASWSLFLPTTVHGRVSDIWRSYIAQTVGRYFGLQTAFLPDPLVRQDRNVHDYLADLNSEIPLYECAGAFVHLLNAWQAPVNSTLPVALLELYIDLYEHGVLQAKDVDLIQHWLQSLATVGYTFPLWNDRGHDQDNCSPFTKSFKAKTVLASTDDSPLVVEPSPSIRARPIRRKLLDVALVGQFNYDTTPELVIHWAKRWSEIFRVVSAWGPFSEVNYQTLKDHGIDVVVYPADEGYYSPMMNLGQALVRFESDPTIQGVLICHDDMMANITKLEEGGFPGNGNILIQDSMPGSSRQVFFNNNSMVWEDKSHAFVTVNQYMKGVDLKQWGRWRIIIPAFSNAVSNDTRSSKYVNASGIAQTYGVSPGDFVYIPTTYATFVYETAQWLGDNKVFLEVGMITMVGHLMDRYGANVTVVKTCTTWKYEDRRKTKFVKDCLLNNSGHTLYHPIKPSLGLNVWDGFFDSIV